ncbi:hypothetical protein Hanom_Chr11g00994041 [Helianthus anomalus]
MSSPFDPIVISDSNKEYLDDVSDDDSMVDFVPGLDPEYDLEKEDFDPKEVANYPTDEEMMHFESDDEDGTVALGGDVLVDGEVVPGAFVGGDVIINVIVDGDVIHDVVPVDGDVIPEVVHVVGDAIPVDHVDYVIVEDGDHDVVILEGSDVDTWTIDDSVTVGVVVPASVEVGEPPHPIPFWEVDVYTGGHMREIPSVFSMEVRHVPLFWIILLRG